MYNHRLHCKDERTKSPKSLARPGERSRICWTLQTPPAFCCLQGAAVLCRMPSVPGRGSSLDKESWQKPPWSLLGWKGPGQGRVPCLHNQPLLFDPSSDSSPSPRPPETLLRHFSQTWDETWDSASGNSLPSPHALCIPQHRENANLNDKA